MKMQSLSLQTLDVPSDDSLLMTVVGALALIIMLMVFLAWSVKRSGITRRLQGGQSTLNVVTTTTLGARERLVLVDLGEQRLLLGVTATQITTLATQAKPDTHHSTASASFPSVLSVLRRASEKETSK